MSQRTARTIVVDQQGLTNDEGVSAKDQYKS